MKAEKVRASEWKKCVIPCAHKRPHEHSEAYGCIGVGCDVSNKCKCVPVKPRRRAKR
jgi:hypothetical protein